MASIHTRKLHKVGGSYMIALPKNKIEGYDDVTFMLFTKSEIEALMPKHIKQLYDLKKKQNALTKEDKKDLREAFGV